MGSVEGHYAVGNILEGIRNAVGGRDSVTVDELKAVDEFHIGGRTASERFFPQLGLVEGQKILDIGAGIGGGARFAADRYGVTVTGIDLTPEYVEVGEELNRWSGMEGRVTLEVGDATDLRFSDASFDGAFTMHVLMNIADKAKVFSEVFRVLKPGSVFGIYDVVKYGEGEITFPVPWATDSSESFLATIDEYRNGLADAGFEVESVTDRYEFGAAFFTSVREKLRAAGGPPPLGIHLLMGSDSPEKVENITENLVDGLIAPFQGKGTQINTNEEGYS